MPQPPYLLAMLRKQLEIPPQAAKAFVRDMRAFFKATEPEAHEIAARQCRVLQQYQGPREKAAVSNVKQMFLQMKEHA
jgi:hypothetical protein